MKKNIFKLSVVCGLFLLLSCKDTGPQKKELALSNAYDSISYCIGVSFANQFINNLKQSPVDSINIDLFVDAIKCTYNKDSLKIELSKAMEYLNRYFREIQQKEKEEALKQYQPNLDAGRKFLEENSKKEGIVTLPSGLQYQVIKTGSGIKPQPTDVIKVHYTGTLIDGTVFDSSVGKKEGPLVIQLNRLIPGWIEALQLMPVGSKWKLFIPYELGYGDQEQGAIKPYSALIFEIELLSIEKPKK